MSFSIFIWHQIFLAFYRYFISSELTLTFVLLFVIFVFSVSFISYKYIEQGVKVSKISITTVFIIALISTIFGGVIYMKAGVVRDVPELNISTNSAHRGMHGEYCDRIYNYDKDFPKKDNGKLNVLVVGISYGRDMANVILESKYKDSINLSYIFKWNEKQAYRVKDADYIFSFSSNTIDSLISFK